MMTHLNRLLLAVAVIVVTAMSARAARPLDKVVPLDSIPPTERWVIHKGDTIPAILTQQNYSRFDRGLHNHLFIPEGTWAFGLTASYGELKTEDVQLLSIMTDLDFYGKMYSVKPTVSYMFRSNKMIGLRFTYTRGEANLDGLKVDFDDDINFDLSGVSYYSQTYGASVFYRYYVGLGPERRFAVFNEVDCGFSSGSARFKRNYDGQPKDTQTITTSGNLNFSPGVTVFIMDRAAFNISFGVFGLHWTHQTQTTDGVRDGSRTTSGANFRFNIFNINFGLSIFI